MGLYRGPVARGNGGDRGVSFAEYAALVVLAALILGALVAIGVPQQISSGVGTEICKIFGGGNCGGGKPPANGGPGNGPGQPTGPVAAPRPTDPLQVRTADVVDYPQPNPQPQAPPPPPGQNNAVTQTPWGPSTGAGPGNPGIGDSGDLPTGGDHPYVPPKSGRGKPVKIRGKKAWIDNRGRTWEWDRLHKDHWDVTDKNGDHINVNPDGSEARKPKGGKPSPTPAPSQPPGGGKSHFDWKPWGIGAGAAGAGGLLWWGGKLRSPACGPFAPACAIVL